MYNNKNKLKVDIFLFNELGYFIGNSYTKYFIHTNLT